MYEKELEFLKNTLRDANKKFVNGKCSVSDKGAFDVVTDVDREIELYFSEELKKHFPGDVLHGEEFSSDVPLTDRTWMQVGV